MASAARKIEAAADYTVIETKPVGCSAKSAAELFGAMLGADLGVGSRIVRVNARTYDCVADDNRAIRFTGSPPLRLVR